jgi:hypothetical protein
MIESFYLELIALIVAIFSYSRLKGSYMIWFIPFLLITFSVEVASHYLYEILQLSSYWVYNITIPLTSIFYGFILFCLMNNSKLKLPFIVLGVIYSLLSLYFLSYATGFSINSLITSAVILVSLSCYYFYRCLLDDIDLNNFKIKSGLYLASGILIFYAGVSIVFSLFDYIRKHDLRIFGYHLYNVIPNYLSIILYACISIALIKWKKRQEI